MDIKWKTTEVVVGRWRECDRVKERRQLRYKNSDLGI